MLVFSANVKREWAGNGMRAHAGDGVEALRVGAAEVVNDGLPEVVAVAQWRSGDVRDARINRVEAHSNIGRAIQARGFVCEFVS